MRRILGLVFALATMLAAQPARAQGIDGSWCRNEQRLTIMGNSITTPGGNQTQGQNNGDMFSWSVPQGEPGAGGYLTLQQLSDNEAQIRTGEHAPPQIWRRCSPPVS